VGRGVPQEYAKAANWYQKAANQGVDTAQANLGFLYLNGLGVRQDYVIAHMWFNLAVAGGLTDATKNREAAAAKMTPVQIAEAQRLAREWKVTHYVPP
jgi:TPR repeat protein